MAKHKTSDNVLRKFKTGFHGFDNMTNGGLPKARISMVQGGAGSGKTLFTLQTLCHWLKEKNNIGIFVSFEEDPDKVKANIASFDWSQTLFSDKRLILIDARWNPDVIQTGNFDLSGLLSAVEGLIKDNQAGFLVLDGIDALLSMMLDTKDVRRELLRLQHWTESQRLTTIITMKGQAPIEGQSGRGFLEDIATYAADCVVELERTSFNGIANRTLCIQKYRGSDHTQNKVPYIIGEQGIEIAPADADSGGFRVYSQRVSTGVADLDEMLGGGIFRGSTTLLTGSPGTTKTTLASSIAATACQRNEKVLFICFDESPEEIVRNMTSVNIDLEEAVKTGKLQMQGFVARAYGPDLLVGRIRKLLDELKPRFLVLDPVSAFAAVGSEELGYSAVRLIIHDCKHRGITIILTSLIESVDQNLEKSKAHISTLSDNWIHLSYVINGGERNRALTIVKSRGTGHSNQVRELILNDHGIRLEAVYTEEGEVLMGAMRWQREEKTRKEHFKERMETEKKYRDATRQISDISSQIRELEAILEERRHDLENFRDEVSLSGGQEDLRRETLGNIRKSTQKAPRGRSPKRQEQ